MLTKKISVIIPLYNQAKQLAEGLDSLTKQTIIKNGFLDGLFEVIIINDGSDNISREEIESLVSNFKELEISIIHQENKGAPVARNKGFEKSTGEYVIFCDADVVMKPEMLEKMIKVLDKNPEVSYVYSSFKFGFKKFKLWEFNPETLKKIPYIHTTSLIRRNSFIGFDESLKRFQDWDLWLAMLKKGYQGKWINDSLFNVKTGGTISKWLPGFLANKDKGYLSAKEIIIKKHNL
jgi:glycosyltransferase involved in cell wall biosynthesis